MVHDLRSGLGEPISGVAGLEGGGAMRLARMGAVALLGAGAILAATAMPGLAQEAAETAADTASAETAFVFNTLLFLISGMVVMFMAAGFCMLEVGMVRSRNAGTICIKNISLYSISGIMYFVVGYNLMYGGGDYWGTFAVWMPDDAAAVAETGADYSAGYGSHSDWFFQMVFCATAASIVSGTLAERIRLWPFLIFVAVLTGFLYPITGSWEWGAGWLDQLGFSDFAGSTLVHSVGGWAALAGAIILGARTGRYDEKGRPLAMPGSSLPLATLGTFILWLGWFGFNGGSQLALGSASDAVSVGQIFANTNTAAASGVVVSMIVSQLVYKRVDLTIALNGAIGGLVAITAEPLTPMMWQAVVIGGVGGVIVALSIPLLDLLRIDDVVGAIPAHLFCGIWGTLIVPWTNTEVGLWPQFLGVISIGAFTLIASTIVWLLLRFTMGIRATPEMEMEGLDRTELGLHAYPEFVKP